MQKNSHDTFKNDLWNGILNCPIVYVNHFHLQYVDEVLKELLSEHGQSEKDVVEYDNGQGAVVSFDTKKKDSFMKKYTTIKSLLRLLVVNQEEVVDDEDDESYNPMSIKRLFIFKGLNDKILRDEDVHSLLLTFASKYEAGEYDYRTTILIVSPQNVSIFPPTVLQYVTVVELLSPTAEEIRDYIISVIGPDKCIGVRSKSIVEDMVRTLQGLQMYDVRQILRTALSLSNNRLSNRATAIALKEKKRIVKKSGIIEVIDTDISFSDVGGLQKLRKDLEIKSAIYKNLGDAEKYNVPIPKGILIIGMPGCGKSLIAQATANLFGVSLLRLDVSRLMGKYVGESEANLRLALATAEAAHPCVLWIDEIEKAFAGGNNRSGDNDMLVMRMMGHFLTWMQERKTPVYIVATANDVMRPEFMRKGRFDEVYFVDFPSEEERAQILKVKIDKRYPQNAKDRLFDFSEIIKDDCKEVVAGMKGEYGGFSGSEIECILNMVVETKFQSYLNGKNSSTNQDVAPSLIKITKADFKKAIVTIKSSVLANQKSKPREEKDLLREKTSIERIRDLQDTYKFVSASKEN